MAKTKTTTKQPKTPIVDTTITEVEENYRNPDFPVVGIGASAGGLAAFEEFFNGLPSDKNPDMAFILVQHLAPDHKSILTEIIQRFTTLTVSEVTDGILVQSNNVYIIPPNRDMAFLNGTLQLFERTHQNGANMPIDFFFKSLADDLYERAICIVLSGTGSDGTLGLRSVKAVGGLALAQSPKTTKYDGMPSSAIATGLVDYIMPPRDMVSQIQAYISNLANYIIEDLLLPAEQQSIKKVFVLLRTRTGHDFSKYKPSTIHRRIERRLAIHQIESMEHYIKFLHQTPSEVDALFYDLLIGVTKFFRDQEAFAFVESEIIPKLFKNKEPGEEIRVWCAGCSTGEEAYSLAILIQECIETLQVHYDVKLFATDIDNNAISIARKGVYSNIIDSDISPARLTKFFKLEPETAQYRINKSIRDMVIFSEQSVIKDPPFSKLDFISCRNLMIYLGNTLQKKLIPLFHYALKPNGILFLGSSETIGDYNHLFTVLDRKQKVYLRKEDYLGKERTALNLVFPQKVGRMSQTTKATYNLKSIPKQSLKDITEQSILKETSISGILVNAQGDILYLHGRTGMYLEPSPGEASINNVLKMAREGLKHTLTEEFKSVVVGKQIVRLRDVNVKTNGHFTKVHITIKKASFSVTPETEAMYIILLEEAQLQETPIPSTSNSTSPANNIDIQMEELKVELRIKEEYLQAANEELETTNEELSSANEEMQSVNEELQSTNEELETSKEELQSTNEELTTVNAELQSKVQDLSQMNNDMINLLAGTNIATVFLDLKQNILRFTPKATDIVNLIEGDIGRPIAHIVTNLVDYDQLSIDVKSVLDNLTTKTIKVTTKTGKWYDMVIQPYRTIYNVIEGAVITFIDVTEEKNAQNKLAISELRYRSLFETTKEGILIVDGTTGKIQDVNPYLMELLGYSKLEFLEKEIWNIGFLKDIVANKDKFSELQKQKYIRYHNLPLETASGKKIEVEFISNTYIIDNLNIIQCNIRKVI